MKLVTYHSEQGPRIAGLRDGEYVDLNQTDSSLPPEINALLALGEEGIQRAQAAVRSGSALQATDIKLMAPVPTPRKVICIGLNYSDHAAESGMPPPPEPVVFSKFVTSVIGPEEDIILPPISEQVDYEAELVVVIGKTGRSITGRTRHRSRRRLLLWTRCLGPRLATRQTGGAMAHGQDVRHLRSDGALVGDA